MAKKKKRKTPQPHRPGTESAVAADGLKFGPQQVGTASYLMLLVCIAAQALTIFISWPVWECRPLELGTTPNVPWISGTPQFSTGLLLIGSLFLAAISPKKYGVAAHLTILLVSIAMDQFRCQPQVLAVAFMMSACVWATARKLCVWYLIAMWTWAGIHKLLSPDWFGHVTCYLLSDLRGGLANAGIETDFNPSHHYKKFAAFIALFELAVGLLAWRRPKLGAMGCLALHAGISCFLILVNWNYSVLPWNVTTAIVGGWLLWTANSPELKESDNVRRSAENSKHFLQPIRLPQSSWGKCLVALILIFPTGFYFGWVRHSLSHALYSNNLPLGMASQRSGIEYFDCWNELSVPFPNVHKTYRDYFRITGEAGDKLHILAMRTGDSSQFFIHKGNQKIFEVSEQRFFNEDLPGPNGVGIDNPRKAFSLEVVGATLLKRDMEGMIYAVQYNHLYFKPEHLDLLSGLPNVEQLQLANCNLHDGDLDRLPVLIKLKGIGISGTKLTDAGISPLKKQPKLKSIEAKNTRVSGEGIEAVLQGSPTTEE